MVTKGEMLDMSRKQLIATLVALYHDDPTGWEHFFQGMNKEQLRTSLTKRQDYVAKKI